MTPMRPFTVIAWLSLAAALAVGVYATIQSDYQGSNPDSNGWGIAARNGQGMIFNHHAILISFPLGVLVIPFAIPPMVWAVLAYKREQRKKGQGFPIQEPSVQPEQTPSDLL